MRALLIALCLLPALARAAPVVDVYTMGVGDDLFSAFGHAAICVTDEEMPRGRCYNYGTADFSTPVPLTWNFLRGRARFWVSTIDAPRMLAFYATAGRAVWRQRLPLDAPTGARVAAALAASTVGAAKYYRYHHFKDNCTTRIRDVLDRATAGRLSAHPRAGGPTFRQWAEAGFAGNIPLLAVVELVLGRSADQHTDSWSAMFLPSELRAELARRFDASPILVVPGRLQPASRAVWPGAVLFVALGAALALGLIVGAGRGRRGFRAALGLTAVVLGLVGTVLWALAALSTFPELRVNEALLAFWPTDLLLPWLTGRRLRGYLTARVVVLMLVMAAHVGLLVQPLAPTLLALLPLGTAWALVRIRGTSSQPG